MNDFNDYYLVYSIYLKTQNSSQDSACVEIHESEYLKVSVSLAFDPMFFSIPEYFRAP